MTHVRTGGKVLVDQLELHGVETVYCVPGESYLEVLDALHDAKIRTVVCRQEGGAGYMAEAHGRLTGLGVCMVTRGPGAANAMVSIHQAWQDRTPLLLLVGLIPRGERGREAFQEFDLPAWFGTTAKMVTTIDQAERVPEILARAISVARSGRPGPVVVGLPEDMLRDLTEAADAEPLPTPASELSARQTEELTGLVRAAQRPLVVLGGAPWSVEASGGVQAWAERWQLPVVTDFRHQDLVDNESPSYVGWLGFGRDAVLAAALAEADLIISVGSPLGDVATDGWTLQEAPNAQARIVSVLPDPEAHAALHRSRLRIVATPQAFADALSCIQEPIDPAWADRTLELRRAHERFREPVPCQDDLDLGAVMSVVRDELGDGLVATFGAGNHAHWPQRFLVHRTYPSQLASRNGSMGYGVPAAVAAAIALPGRRVVSVAGDGCYMMNGQELATAVAEGVAPIILVMNNGMYGTIRQHQEAAHPGRVSGTNLTNPDFAALARAYGAHGETVTHTGEFRDALRRAVASGLPAVIELRVREDRLGPDTTIAQLNTAGGGVTAGAH
ncbi:thiamine pyrophosphate-dependent enzyme [Streptomyces sp. NPDC001661]